MIGIDSTSKRFYERLNKTKPERLHHRLIKLIPPIHYLTSRRMGTTYAQFIDLLFSNLNAAKLALSPADILLVPQVSHLDQFSFHQAKEFVKEGEKATLEALPEIKRLLKD